MPLVSRTRATLRSAEFGFLGVWVRTWVHTPRFCGEPDLPSTLRSRFVWELKLKSSAGAVAFLAFGVRPFRTSWLIVGIAVPCVGLLGRPESRLRGFWACGHYWFWARKQAGKPVREQRPNLY